MDKAGRQAGGSPRLGRGGGALGQVIAGGEGEQRADSTLSLCTLVLFSLKWGLKVPTIFLEMMKVK